MYLFLLIYIKSELEEMTGYTRDVMAATVKVKMKTERPLMTRGAVLEEVKDHLPVSNIQALCRCGEARDWYFTFDSPSIVDEVGDTHFIGKSGAEVEVERIDKRRARFRVHWYPFFMDISSIEQHMDRFGSRIQLEYETQNYEGVRIKTGTISGTMISTENQFQSIPYRSTVCGRPVLLTVMGRASVCLRCGQVGHQRATCPQRVSHVAMLLLPEETTLNGPLSSGNRTKPELSLDQ